MKSRSNDDQLTELLDTIKDKPTITSIGNSHEAMLAHIRRDETLCNQQC